MAGNLGKIFVLSLLFQGVELNLINSMQRRLLERLNNDSSDLLPVERPNEAVKVEFGIVLVKIKDVDAKEQTIQVHVWIAQKWHNSFLKWNVSNFGNISSVNVKAENIWVPDIVLYNNVDEQDRTGGGRDTYKTLVRLYNNGTNFWSSPALFKAICEIKVDYFPLDQQTCALKFGSWSYDATKLRIVPNDIEFPSSFYMKNGEWGIYNVHLTTNNMSYPGRPGDYSDITLTIKMQRQYIDYFVNLVIPCLMISCMTFLGFILPPESGERIGLSITVLLAMTVFQQLTSEIMPSYDIPLLGRYYLATILEIGLALLVTTIILNFYHRTNRHMPRWLRIVVLHWLARFVFLHESAEKCTKPRKKTVKRGVKDNIDAVINNGFVIGEHPLSAAENGNRGAFENGNGCDTDDPIRQRSNTINKPADTNVLKLTLGSIGSELNPHTQSNEGFFTDESGVAVSEDEMRMRHQQWTLAAKVLDRCALWMTLIGGVATFLAVFLRAPRLWSGEADLKYNG